MPWITKDGRTVEEARAAVVAHLGLPEEDLEVEVLNEGAKGLFGFGGEPAVVRARPRTEAVDVRDAFHDDPSRPPAPLDPEPQVNADVTGSDDGDGTDPDERQEVTQQVALEMVEGILQRMGLSGDVRSRVDGGTVYVEVSGEDMGILIGRGGATLEALQELVRAGVQRRLKARGSVVVDVESYWERRKGGRRSGDRPRANGGAGAPRRTREDPADISEGS
ncbi:MAG TPA: Jag N-terminal domain-containing protein [Actinomycetota bacterium]|nr:Jag N-terminal domain-containing protein [Actinomycetota bacterium]